MNSKSMFMRLSSTALVALALSTPSLQAGCFGLFGGKRAEDPENGEGHPTSSHAAASPDKQTLEPLSRIQIVRKGIVHFGHDAKEWWDNLPTYKKATVIFLLGTGGAGAGVGIAWALGVFGTTTTAATLGAAHNKFFHNLPSQTESGQNTGGAATSMSPETEEQTLNNLIGGTEQYGTPEEVDALSSTPAAKDTEDATLSPVEKLLKGRMVRIASDGNQMKYDFFSSNNMDNPLFTLKTTNPDNAETELVEQLVPKTNMLRADAQEAASDMALLQPYVGTGTMDLEPQEFLNFVTLARNQRNEIEGFSLDFWNMIENQTRGATQGCVVHVQGDTAGWSHDDGSIVIRGPIHSPDVQRQLLEECPQEAAAARAALRT